MCALPFESLEVLIVLVLGGLGLFARFWFRANIGSQFVESLEIHCVDMFTILVNVEPHRRRKSPSLAGFVYSFPSSNSCNYGLQVSIETNIRKRNNLPTTGLLFFAEGPRLEVEVESSVHIHSLKAKKRLTLGII